MVLLDAVVEQRESVPLLPFPKRSLESPESARSPEVRQPSPDPPHDMDRPPDLGSSLVRNSRVRPSLHNLRRQMFLLRSPPIREQHELLLRVLHGSLEEPSSPRSLATSHFFSRRQMFHPPRTSTSSLTFEFRNPPKPSPL